MPRSHKLGRLDHIRIGGQNGADPERLKEVTTSTMIHDIDYDTDLNSKLRSNIGEENTRGKECDYGSW